MAAILFGSVCTRARAQLWGGGDAELLRLVAEAHRANVDKIMTWRGRVTVTTTGVHGMPYPENAVVEFAYDRSKRASLWKWIAQNDAGADEGDIRDMPMGALRHGMIIDGSLYWLNAKDVGTPFASLTIAPASQIKRSPMGFDFQVMYWLSDDYDDVGRRFRLYYDLHKQGQDLPDVCVVRVGEKVILEIKRDDLLNRYTVDLSQGALLVAYDAGTSEWRFTNEEHGGAWVRKAISYVWRSHNRKLVWTENVVNEPLAPDEFSLARLGVRKGNRAFDVRTKASFKVEDIQ